MSPPAFTTLSNGVSIATAVPGSGQQIQDGQTANVLYTGYLAQTGQIFDDSLDHGGAPLSFVLGSGELIPGFDTGTVGMRVGETRIHRDPAVSRLRVHGQRFHTSEFDAHLCCDTRIDFVSMGCGKLSLSR